MRKTGASSVALGFAIALRAGLIRYQHGRITVLGRTGLEDAACECYEAVASEYRRLFGEYRAGLAPPSPI